MSFLLIIEFTPCLKDPYIVLYNPSIIIFFYIDNFLYISPYLQVQEIATLKKVLNKKYGIKNLGPIFSFLNIKITRDCKARILQILQRLYINKLITKFHLKAILQHLIQISLTPYFKTVPHTEQATDIQQREY